MTAVTVRTNSTVVVGVLRRGQAIADQGLDGVGGTLELNPEVLAFGRGEVAQDEIGWILAPWRPADAETHPVELTGAQRLTQRPQPVVPVVAATLLQPERARRQVQLVMHHDDAVDRRLEEVAQRRSGATRVVHVRPRLGEHCPLAGEPGLDHFAASLVALELPTDPPGKDVEHHEADVVPVAGVLRAWVAQAEHEPGASVGHCLRPR